jgi:hypothetical protein
MAAGAAHTRHQSVVWQPADLVPHANDVFDAALAIQDSAVQDRLRRFLAGFVAAVRHAQR